MKERCSRINFVPWRLLSPSLSLKRSKLNNIRLCETVLGSVDNAIQVNKNLKSSRDLSGEEGYSIADRVTFKYYVGRLRLSQHRITAVSSRPTGLSGEWSKRNRQKRTDSQYSNLLIWFSRSLSSSHFWDLSHLFHTGRQSTKVVFR